MGNYCVAFTALSLDPIYSADLVGSLGEYASYQETTGNSGTATAPVCSSGGSSCADDPYDTNFDGMVDVDALLRSLVLGLFRENAGCADCANFFPICAK